MAGLTTALIHGWTQPGLGSWSVKSVENAAFQEWVNEEVGVVALQVSCALSLIDVEAAEALPEFLRVGGEWSLPALDDRVIEVRTAA